MIKKFFAIVICFLMLGCSQTFDLEERSVALADFLDNGKNVAKLSDNPEVLKAIEYLSAAAYIAEPLSDIDNKSLVSRAVEKVPAIDFPIRTVLLKKEDCSIGENWEKIYESQIFAFVIPSPEFLFVIKMDSKMTSFFKGVVAVHESLHVVDFVTDVAGKIKDDSARRAFLEFHAYYRCCEIFRKVGGDRYAKAVMSEAKRLKKIKNEDWKLSKEFMLNAESIFGKSLSQEENGIRETNFMMDVVFTFFDITEENKNKRNMEKFRYIKEFHDSNIAF